MLMNKTVIGILVLIFCATLLDAQQKPKKEYTGPIDYYPDWEVGNFVYPQINIPDSLGGTKLKGYINILVYVCKEGEKVGFEITKIYLTKSTRKNAKEYFYMQITHEGDSLLTLFTPWVRTFYDSLKFIVKRNSLSFKVQDTLSTLQTILFNRERTNVLNIIKRKL